MLTLALCVLLLLLLLLVVAERVFLVFRGEKRLFGTSRTRVGCFVHSFSVNVYVSVSSCVIQHVFRPRLSTALNAHGTNASPGGLCGAHTNETFSCWCGYKS